MKYRYLIVVLFIFYSCELNYADFSSADTIDKEKMLELVNQSRTEGCNCGDEYMPPVNPLEWNSDLEDVALAHSIDMNLNNFFSHTNLKGEGPWDRVNFLDSDILLRGENIALGYLTEEDVIRGWLNSPGHCRNLMSQSHTIMGIGKSGKYWTQLFGRKTE
ncbi:MAG: CAP domain-containing protein [bacterium]